MSEKHKTRKRVFAFVGVVFVALLISLGVASTFAPDAIELQSSIGTLLLVWCLPMLLVALQMSKGNTRISVAAQPPGQEIVITVITFLMLLLCLAGFVNFGPKFRGALLTRPQDFTKTQGKIVLSQVIFQPGGKTSPSWRYKVVYSYRVAAASYSSNMVNFDWIEAKSDRSSVLGLTQKYSVEQIVPVFYLANDPAFATLDPEQKGTTIYLFVVLITITACCGISCLHSLRLMRTQSHR